jgi:hypothetical protein
MANFAEAGETRLPVEGILKRRVVDHALHAQVRYRAQLVRVLAKLVWKSGQWP